MTTANKITIFRVILIPVFLVLMYLRFPGHMYWAFGVFVLASLSDFADGYIARHYNQVSDFGSSCQHLIRGFVRRRDRRRRSR